MHKTHADSRSPWLIALYFVFAVLFLYLALADSITTPFVYHDQTRYFGEDFHHASFKASCENDHISRFLSEIGRPVAAGIECAVFKNVSSLEDISVVRFIALALFALGAALLTYEFVPLVGGRWTALFLSCSIIVLPGMQVAVFQGAIPNGLAVVLSVLSYILLPDMSKMPGMRLSALIARVLVALGLFMVILVTYQVYAFMFLALTMATVLLCDRDRWRGVRLNALRDIVFVGIASAVYFVAARLLIGDSLGGVPGPYKIQISSDIPNRLSLFFREAVPAVFNMWNIYTSWTVAIVALGVIASGAAAAFVLSRGKRSEGQAMGLRRYAAEKTVVAAVLFLAACAPWVFSQAVFVLLRIFLPAMAMAVLLMFWALENWAGVLIKSDEARQKAITVAAFLMFIGGGVYANVNMSRNVWNTSVEFSFIQKSIAEGINSSTDRIHVIRPRRDDTGYNGLPSINDEFNRKATEFMPDITDLVRAALLREVDSESFIIFGCDKRPDVCVKEHTHKDPRGILVTHSREGQPVHETPGTLIVDMTELRRNTYGVKTR